MSRIPQPSSSKPTSSAKSPSSIPPSTPSRPRVLTSSTIALSTPRARVQSSARMVGSTVKPTPTKPNNVPGTPAVRKTASTLSLKSKTSTSAPRSPSKPKPASHVVEEKPPTAQSISIREAIALKRAEAKKAQAKSSSSGFDNMSNLEEALPPHAIPALEEDDLLGRASIREVIEKARSSGTVNLATRSLKCLPSALFEIHLNITPDALKSVPDEPSLPPAPEPTGRLSRKGAPAWFEAQDLQVLKAWSNEIQEIQHEISLFGSLKVIDLHNNKLTSLPDTMADLPMLTNLDLSHNALTSLPIKLFALPELVNLNISHNALTSIPFNAYFTSSEIRRRNNHNSSTNFFAPEITRATSPLPRLVTFDASYNEITAASIDLTFPSTLTKLNLSGNPLGPSQLLLKALAVLPRIKELCMAKADIGDDSFPSDLFPPNSFPSLKIFDLSETKVTWNIIKVALVEIKRELNNDFVEEEPPEGVVRVLTGKKIIKESWEIELEKRTKHRVNKSFDLGGDWDEAPRHSSLSPAPSSTIDSVRSSRSVRPIQEVVKEAWEVVADAGLPTEGDGRRERAVADEDTKAIKRTGTESPPSPSKSPSSNGLSLSSPQYYSPATHALALPPSSPPKSTGHNRAFSLANPSPKKLLSSPSHVAIPLPTLPLDVIVAQPFAQTLVSLTLVNRRADRCLALPLSQPSDPQGFLPLLEELDLEGCNLPDSVPVLRCDASSEISSPPPRTTEPLLPLLASLFPSLRTLNLSYNALTSSALKHEVLSSLILACDNNATGTQRKGLRHLRLRGNKIDDLDGFQELANTFKGNRDVPEWKLEELDLRDNEIGKLPPELGLMPLDVFLVDGNTFRVPQRRIWEREGTKGLLSWLRGRIE